MCTEDFTVFSRRFEILPTYMPSSPLGVCNTLIIRTYVLLMDTPVNHTNLNQSITFMVALICS